MKRPTWTRGALGLVGALGLALAGAVSASANPKPLGPRPSKIAPAAVDLAAIASDLSRSEDLGRGLLAARGAGPAARSLAPQVERRLEGGLPPELAIQAIEALSAMGAPSSSPAIAPYLSHRDPTVREAAARALGRTAGPDAKAPLLRALRSMDPAVRALAAAGLRAAGDASAVPDLQRALDRGVDEAAPAIAAHCEGAPCDELIARLGALPFALRKTTLEALLGRRPALADDVLIRAIAAARAALGPAERPYFKALKAGFKSSAKVRKALDEAARPDKEERR